MRSMTGGSRIPPSKWVPLSIAAIASAITAWMAGRGWWLGDELLLSAKRGSGTPLADVLTRFAQSVEPTTPVISSVVLGVSLFATCVGLLAIVARLGVRSTAARTIVTIAAAPGFAGTVAVWPYAAATVALPVALVLAQLLVVDRREPSAANLALVTGLGVVAVSASPVGIVGSIFVAVLVVWRWSSRHLTFALLPTWLVAAVVHRHGDLLARPAAGTPSSVAHRSPWSWSPLLPWPVAGPIMVAVLFAALAIHVRRPHPSRALLLVVTVWGPVTLVLQAVGPFVLGPTLWWADAARYTALVSVIPIAAITVDLLANVKPIGDTVPTTFFRALATVVAAGLVVANVNATDDQRQPAQESAEVLRRHLDTLWAMPGFEGVTPSLEINVDEAAGLTVGDVATLADSAIVQPVVPVPQEAADHHVLYFVDANAPGAGEPARQELLFFGSLEPAADGCSTVRVTSSISQRLWLQLQPTTDNASTVSIRSSTGSLQLIALQGNARSQERSVTWSGDRVRLLVHDGGVHMVLLLTDGTTVCGLETGAAP